MKRVKRCNDDVVALLIILPAPYLRFTFQKIQFIIVFARLQKERQKC